MKKVKKEDLIQILKNKKNSTYEELSKITGYHTKSLIRINSQIKKGKINKEKSSKEELIIQRYLNNNFKKIIDFYNSKSFDFNISYSNLCKILNKVTIKKEIVLIKKIKKIGDCQFEIIDIKNKTLLFKIKSKKNNTKSLTKILEILLKKFGAPDYITFSNISYYEDNKIKNILNYYSISLLPYKTIYKNISSNKLLLNLDIKYKQVTLQKELFYNCIIRKTINTNVIQFNNVRYLIQTKLNIKKNTKVLLYYNDKKDDLFINYKNKKLKLKKLQSLKSKKGNSKYL